MFHGEGAEQVAFTANATQALNTALKGILNPGDTLITTVLEHNSVLRPAYELEESGICLRIIESDSLGRFPYERLEQVMEEDRAAKKTEGIAGTAGGGRFCGNPCVQSDR